MRLGFTTKVFGWADMPAYDGRSASLAPHLSVSLAYLTDILHYVQANDIHMYRMHTKLLPLSADADWDDHWQQLQSCEIQLTLAGSLARQADIRLSFHPYSSVVLNALNEDQVARSLVLLQAQATVLDMMALGPDAVIVLHVGGVYDDMDHAIERFILVYESLPLWIRRRLVVENDDHRFSHTATRRIHERCGVPLILDNLHHQVFNPEGVPMREALEYALATWPDVRVAKIHFATPRSELRTLGAQRLKTPTWKEHADFVNPFEFIHFMDLAQGLPDFDIMLEAKARDLALLKLREDLELFAPLLVSRFC